MSSMDVLDHRARNPISGLTPQQRAITVLVPFWHLVQAEDPEAWKQAVSQMKSGSMGAGVSDGWFRTMPKGLEYKITEPEEARGFITWTEVRKIILSAPSARYERLKVARARYLESQKSYPRFSASPQATGCGPTFGKPREEWTDAQRLMEQELEAHRAEKLEPWEEERRIIDIEVRASIASLWEPVRMVTIGGVEMVLGL